MTAAGVVIIAAQPSGTGALVLSLVAYVAGARLTRTPGLVTVSAATVATVVALAVEDSRPTIAISSSVLLAALLFVMARLFRRAQADRERAEVATAELEDARERELEAASVAERGRIARELHDVLAHSLSGLSLQLEGARLVAERERASEELQEMLARSRRLAADGLEDARRAVRTLRGDSLPGLDDLARLVEDFSRGGLEVELSVRGDRRAVSTEAGLALYRAAQEALTNTVRHSGASDAALDLEFAEATVRLTITDRGASGIEPAADPRRRRQRLRAERHARASRNARRRRHGGPHRVGLSRRARAAVVSGEAIRVVIADDQRVVREGLETLLDLLEGLDVVGVAGDGEAAVALALEADADVVLMDLRMPRVDGVEATRLLREQRPSVRVLVLTTYAEDDVLFPALRAGARGYLTKDAGAEEIAAAIHAVHRGETHLDPAVQARLVAAVVDGPQAAGPPPDELTPREAEVLTLIARGLSNAEIAEQLVVSAATVKTHINRIFMKIGARDRAQAVRYAFQHGLA